MPALPLAVVVAALVSAAMLGACKDREPAVAPTAPAEQIAAAANPPVAKPALSFEDALKQAQAQQLPLLVDFHAPWCYSCYYMATNVLTGAEWQALTQRALVVEVDAESPEGAALKARYGIKALPSYLMLAADGRELGRILGERTRAEFYAAATEMLDRGQTLDALAAEVRDSAPASRQAALTVLKSYHARYDAEGGLQWLAQLPLPVREALQADAGTQLAIERLRFLRAAQNQDAQAALASGQQVLSGALGCERAYELGRYLEFASAAPDAAARLSAQRPAIERLLADGVFGATPCADQRSVVLVAAELYAAQTDRAAQQALLQRAIGEVAKQIGDDLRKDRNLSDNLRVYTDQLAALTGDYAALDALMPKLIATWPGDYVYASRYGRSLLARGRAAEALPYLEQATQQAYGINRLKVAQERVRALQALDRGAEARVVVAEALKANGPWFPEEAAKLKALLQG